MSSAGVPTTFDAIVGRLVLFHLRIRNDRSPPYPESAGPLSSRRFYIGAVRTEPPVARVPRPATGRRAFRAGASPTIGARLGRSREPGRQLPVRHPGIPAARDPAAALLAGVVRSLARNHHSWHRHGRATGPRHAGATAPTNFVTLRPFSSADSGRRGDDGRQDGTDQRDRSRCPRSFDLQRAGGSVTRPFGGIVAKGRRNIARNTNSGIGGGPWQDARCARTKVEGGWASVVSSSRT